MSRHAVGQDTRRCTSASGDMPGGMPSGVRLDFFRHSTPVTGAMGRKNIKTVSKRFKFQGYIEDPGLRSIMLGQLLQVQDFAAGQCNIWGVETASISICNIMEWVVKPCTREPNSAFIEHMTNTGLMPAWFVSHWWGDLMDKFLKCIRQQIAVRGLSSKTGYWVCAFANRHHDALDASIAADPKETTCYKAMQAAHFRVLLIVNSSACPVGPGIPFNRTWCAFECERSAPFFDVAATTEAICDEEVPIQLITSGLTSSEQCANKYIAGRGYEAKIQREEGFPPVIAKAAMLFSLKKTQTSIEDDRNRILNFIAGSEAGSEPPIEHDSYHKISRRLRSLFSLILWPQILAGDAPSEKGAYAAYLSMLRDLAKAIQGDWWRKSLTLCLAGSSLHDPEIAELVMHSIPSKLQTLKLGLQHSGLTDASLASMPSCLPDTLQNILVDVSGCEDITDTGVQSFLAKLPRKMQSIEIVFNDTKVSRGLLELAKDGPQAVVEWARSSEDKRKVILTLKLAETEAMQATSKNQQGGAKKFALQMALNSSDVADAVKARIQAEIAVIKKQDDMLRARSK
eukprot:TRINITY_DN22000_c0_g1_i2.p1 TRINITY_DN22000_c0_g1~~TRINITY_DN22000_c0_g1_i2.p1  ORF type:complete len:650 (-),score=118.74 TRINITY_DN22000_c0_g1_i2:14-1720(-)